MGPKFCLAPRLEELYTTTMPASHFSGRSFLLLCHRRGSHQGDSSRFFLLCGYTKAKWDIADMKQPLLASDEVHVWTARLVDNHHAITDLMQSLSPAELRQADQFSFQPDR